MAYRQIIKHREFDIGLTSEFCFQIATEPLKSKCPIYDTIAKARDAIDTHLATVAKSERVKIALDVLTSAGEPVTIKGIHAVTGEALPVVDGGTDFFPATVWVKSLLQEAVAIQGRLNEIRREVHPYRINHSRGYGRMSPAFFDSAIQSLEHEIKEKTEKARKRS